MDETIKVIKASMRIRHGLPDYFGGFSFSMQIREIWSSESFSIASTSLSIVVQVSTKKKNGTAVRSGYSPSERTAVPFKCGLLFEKCLSG